MTSTDQTEYVAPRTGVLYDRRLGREGMPVPMALVCAEPLRAVARFGRVHLEQASVPRRGTHPVGLLAISVLAGEHRADEVSLVLHTAKTVAPFALDPRGSKLGRQISAGDRYTSARHRPAHHTWVLDVPGIGHDRKVLADLMPLETPLVDYAIQVARREAMAAQQEAAQAEKERRDNDERAQTKAVEERLHAWGRSRGLPLRSASHYSNGPDVVWYVHRDLISALLDSAGAPGTD